MSVSPLDRRWWWLAAGLALTSALFVLFTATSAGRAGQGVPTTFLVWSLTPTLTSFLFLLAGLKLQPSSRALPSAIALVNAATMALYALGYWLGVDPDTEFLFIFVPLYENGALIVSGSFTLVLAAMRRLDR